MAQASKLHTFLRWVWYLISLPIFPYFWYKGRLDSWKYPKNGKVVGKQIRMDGGTTTLTMYINPKDTQIQPNIDPHQLNTILGNVS